MIHRISCIVSAAPLFWLAWTLIVLWVSPSSNPDPVSWVRFGVALMLLEFLLLHSGVFVAVGVAAAKTTIRRLAVLAGIVAFYGLFALAFALGTSSRAVLEIYGFVMLGRLFTVFTDADSGAGTILFRSLYGTLVYIPLVFASVIVPWPRLGITSEIVSAARTPNSSGIWVDDPHRAIVAGAIYFFAMGAIEVVLAVRGTQPTMAVS